MSNLTDNWREEKSTQPLPTASKFDLMKNLPNLLRILGAGAVVIAMYSFLVKGWDNGNDIFRYCLMLGHTAALAAIGVASARWLKESKGARLLLTLSLVSIPANFAILGAFIYSQTIPIDSSVYPHYIAWSVDSLNSALLTTGAALLVLGPVTWFGFRVLARNMSKNLTLLFLLCNTILLIPIRDPQWVSAMVLGLGICVIWFSRKISHQHTAAKTQEGFFALALQMLPLAVLIGRSLWLYSMDLFLIAMISVMGFFVLRQVSIALASHSKSVAILDAISIMPAISFGFAFCAALLENRLLMNDIVLPLSALLSAALIYDIASRSSHQSGTYRRFAVVGLSISILTNLVLSASLLAAIISMIIGLGMLFLGNKKQQRSVFSGGVGLLIAGGFQQIFTLFHQFDFSHWASLAAFGVLSIVIASTIESSEGKFKLKINRWRNEYSDWNQ